MRQVKLTKGNQEVIVTSSGEVSLGGRKLNIDIDFESGKVKLYEICEEDGNLTESIKFDTLTFFSNTNTAFNESSKNAPTISGNTLLFEDIENCFCCLSGIDKTNIKAINIDMRGQEYAYDTLLQAKSILTTLNEALSFDNSITVNFHAIDEEQYFLYLEMLRKLSNAKSVSIFIDNDEIPTTTIVEDENNCKKLSFSSKENSVFISKVLTILNSITKTDNLQKKEVLDEDGNVLYEFFVDRINLDEYVDFFNTYHYARDGYVASGYFGDVADTNNYSNTGYMQDGYVAYSVPLSQYEEVDILQDGYVEVGYFKASNKIPFVQENVIELYSFSEYGLDFFDAGCNNFVIGSGSGGSGSGSFDIGDFFDDIFDDIYITTNIIQKWIKIIKDSSISAYEDNYFLYIKNNKFIQKVHIGSNIPYSLFFYLCVEKVEVLETLTDINFHLNNKIKSFYGERLYLKEIVRLFFRKKDFVEDYPINFFNNVKKVNGVSAGDNSSFAVLATNINRDYSEKCFISVLRALTDGKKETSIFPSLKSNYKVVLNNITKNMSKGDREYCKSVCEYLEFVEFEFPDFEFTGYPRDAERWRSKISTSFTLSIVAPYKEVHGVSPSGYYDREYVIRTSSWLPMRYEEKAYYIGIKFINNNFYFNAPILPTVKKTSYYYRCFWRDGTWVCVPEKDKELEYDVNKKKYKEKDNTEKVKYKITRNNDGSIEIEWNNATKKDAKFFKVNSKKLKVGV